MSKKKRFASVWDAIEETPQQAASLRARAELGNDHVDGREAA